MIQQQGQDKRPVVPLEHEFEPGWPGDDGRDVVVHTKSFAHDLFHCNGQENEVRQIIEHRRSSVAAARKPAVILRADVLEFSFRA